jgi:hypothetical protein
MQHVFWKGYTEQERTIFIPSLQPVISSFGDIVDFKLFSDLGMTMTIEIKESCIDPLYIALTAHLNMDPVNPIHSHSSRERTLFLHISFSIGRGELKVEVPAVPG